MKTTPIAEAIKDAKSNSPTSISSEFLSLIYIGLVITNIIILPMKRNMKITIIILTS